MTSFATSSPSGRLATNTRLVVMAKYPAAGEVKTRLAVRLGAEGAAALYRAFVLDLAARLRALPYDTAWAFLPPDAPFADLVPDFRCYPQRGGDLGERMAAAVAAEAERAAGPIMVIGADAPHLPAAALHEAATALAGGAGVVLGPAADGGYYLIGMREPVPVLFGGMAWGTSTVLAETRARADRLGLPTHLLPLGFDVDEVADLDRLRALLARGVVSLPHTDRALGRLAVDTAAGRT